MERNTGRYQYVRRQGHQHHNQSNSSLSSSSSSSLSSAANNHNSDNHRNYSTSSSNSSQYSNAGAAGYTPQSREPLTQHDELIRYIHEAWNKVNMEGTTKIYSHESEPLKNFKPFNLEEYWGQRLVQNLKLSHGHQ